MANKFKMVRINTIMAVLFLMTAQNAVAKKLNLHVDSRPTGAEITVYNTRTDDIIKSCIAPCVLTFKRSKKYVVRSKMPGKLDREHKVTKRTGRGNKTLLFLMRSREEQAQIDKKIAQDRKKWQEQKHQRAQLNTYVYKDVPRQAGEQDVVSDKDAQPLVRIVPIFPPNAKNSGHCRVKYDVLPNGHTTLVETLYCTEPVFKESTLRSVQKWKYAPKLVNGSQTRRFGVQNKVIFNLMDISGDIIPENPISPTLEP